MGRFRVFNNHKTITSSEQNQKLKGITMMKDIRSKQNRNIANNFTLHFCDGYIVQFKSYEVFLDLAKAYFRNNPCCNKCSDIPNNLLDGKYGEVDYYSLFSDISNCDNKKPNNNKKNKKNNYDKLSYGGCSGCQLKHCVDKSRCSKTDRIFNVDICKKQRGTLFPYGSFQNSKNNKDFQFPAKIAIYHCKDKVECPSYCYCNNGKEPHEETYSYEVIFPSNERFIYYTKTDKYVKINDKPHEFKTKPLPCPPPAPKCVKCSFKFIPKEDTGYSCPKCDHKYDKPHGKVEKSEKHYCLKCKKIFNLPAHSITCIYCQHKHTESPYHLSSMNCVKCFREFTPEIPEYDCPTCEEIHKNKKHKHKPFGDCCYELGYYDKSFINGDVDDKDKQCDDVKDKHVLSFSMFPKFKDEDFTLETNITKIDISDLDVNLDNYKSSDKNKNTKIEKPKTILEKNSQYLQKKTYKGLPLESDPNYISARDRMFERLEKNNKKTIY